jgi:nucleotide-binding universal stress UspA family protein
MAEQDINPFDVSSYSSDPNTSVEPTQTEPTQTEPTPAEPTQVEATATQTEPTQTTVEPTQAEPAKVEPAQSEPSEPTKIQFEWENEVAKNIYDSLTTGNISEVADILYEQKVLSELDKMDESDILKLKIAYDYPDLSPDEIEEEFASKYAVDKDFDESLMTEEEIAAKRKQIEKQEKAIARELKKDVREAKDYLQTLKQDISFPDILSQFQEQSQPSVNTEEIVSQYLKTQEEEQAKAYEQARQMYEQSIESGLNAFEGFNVNYKDEEVQFDGKYALSPEEKAQLQNDLKDFDLESFYGPRYYKDGKYDTKQLAEDIYFLQNREKIVNSMVTQAVSKAKADLLKGMKNIDYSNTPRTAAVSDMSDYDKMVGKMFSI